MEPVYYKTKANETVFVDDHYFTKCTFTNYNLVYCGGEYGWENCQFQNCRISIQGAAVRVIAFCQAFGLMRAPDQTPANVVPPSSTQTH